MDNDFSHMRKPSDESAARLSADAIRWLGELPEDKRPAMLASRFARIANKIALLWPDDQATAAYLDSLMFDDRGNRQGFPMPVATELGSLREIVSAKIDARAKRFVASPVAAPGAVPTIDMRPAAKH